MTESYLTASVPRSRPSFSDIVHLISSQFLQKWIRFGFRARVRRAAPLPWGPVVYASNHRSFLDPMMIGGYSPVPVAYFARASLWKNPVFRFFLDTFKGIPIDRDNPGISSMKGAIERLRAGIPVLVFPEGTRTRTGTLGRLKDGPALFARRAGVPLVPVYLHRTEEGWAREGILPRLCGRPVEIRYGRPMVAPAHLAPREQDAWLTRRLDLWMRAQEADCRRNARRNAECRMQNAE